MVLSYGLLFITYIYTYVYFISCVIILNWKLVTMASYTLDVTFTFDVVISLSLYLTSYAKMMYIMDEFPFIIFNFSNCIVNSRIYSILK